MSISTFGGFLQYAIAESKCDSYRREHFKHVVGGYQFDRDYKAFQHELQVWTEEEEVEEDSWDIF